MTSHPHSVIPGRGRQPANPESRNNHGAFIWIPGPLAEFTIGPRFARTRWRASRNDRKNSGERG
jgi:hypothetical protein